MQSVILNGQPASEKDLALLAQALSTPDIVTEKGGYLFKSRMDGETFHFGILPNFLNGQRAYHYEIHIEPSPFNLIGSINPNGTLTVLFKPDRSKIGQPLSHAEKAEYGRQYAQLARFLLQCGLPATFPLDSVSAGVLREMELAVASDVTLGHLPGAS